MSSRHFLQFSKVNCVIVVLCVDMAIVPIVILYFFDKLMQMYKKEQIVFHIHLKPKFLYRNIQSTPSHMS